MVTTAGQQMALQANANVNLNVFGSIIYNVKAYGAKGDWNGTTGTDDTANVQSTINAAISANAKTVFFPPGTYRVPVSPGLTSLTSVTLVGNNARFSGITQDINELGATFAQGPTTAVANASAKLDWVFERNSGRASTDLGGIYTSATKSFIAFEEKIDPSYVGSLADAVFISISNQSPNADSVGLHVLAKALGANTAAFASNLIAGNESGATNSKLVGLEIDIEPTSGTTVSSASAGMYINAFTMNIPGPAVQIGSTFGGKFNNGYLVGSVTGTGLAPAGSASMDSLINTGQGVYATAAVILSNLHKLFFRGVDNVYAQQYVDSANNMRSVLPSGTFVFRDKTDVNSLLSIDNGGIVSVQQGLINFNTTQTAATATAGTAGAPPAQVSKYINIQIGAVGYKIPAYNP